MAVYLGTKVQVSSIILTGFRLGGNFNPPTRSPTSKRTLKSSPRLGLKRPAVGIYLLKVYQKKVLNMFNVNNKDTITTS